MVRKKVVVQKKSRLEQVFGAARSTGNLPNGSWKRQLKRLIGNSGILLVR